MSLRMDSYGLRYDRTLVQVSYVEEKFLKHFSYHLRMHWSPASRPAFLSYRKLRFYTIKNAPRGSHFGGVELCRLRDPPQVENPAKQDSICLLYTSKEKTGVKIDGLTAVNPVNGKEIPIWVSDYVLMSYGTGAIMAVPAHDERDWEFAKKFNMPIIQVVESSEGCLLYTSRCV